MKHLYHSCLSPIYLQSNSIYVSPKRFDDEEKNPFFDGLVGGIKTYGKFSSGDPDTSKTAASWFFACIFLIVAATILRSFFL